MESEVRGEEIMEILKIILGIFGGEAGVGKLIDRLLTKDMIEKLIDKVDREDIELIFIMILSLQSNDAGVKKQALDLVGKIALSQKTVVISGDGDCG